MDDKTDYHWNALKESILPYCISSKCTAYSKFDYYQTVIIIIRCIVQMGQGIREWTKSQILLGPFLNTLTQITTKTFNLLYNHIKSCTFKLQGVPNISNPHLPKIGPNSLIPHSPIVIKINFSKSLRIIYHSIKNLMLMKFYQRASD